MRKEGVKKRRIFPWEHKKVFYFIDKTNRGEQQASTRNSLNLLTKMRFANFSLSHFGRRNVSNSLLHGWTEIEGGGGMPTAFLSTSVPPSAAAAERGAAVRPDSGLGRRLWRTNAGWGTGGRTRERAIAARGKVKEVRHGFSNFPFSRSLRTNVARPSRAMMPQEKFRNHWIAHTHKLHACASPVRT